MPATRHCQHCWGDCDGDCLLPGDTGACIHTLALPFGRRMRLWLMKLRRQAGGRRRVPG